MCSKEYYKDEREFEALKCVQNNMSKMKEKVSLVQFNQQTQAYLGVGGMNTNEIIEMFLGSTSLESDGKALDHFSCVWSNYMHTNNTLLKLIQSIL